jgi:serine/threonine protein kinase
MHSQTFIHQDLNPSNILLNGDIRILIADLGGIPLSEVKSLRDFAIIHVCDERRFNQKRHEIVRDATQDQTDPIVLAGYNLRPNSKLFGSMIALIGVPPQLTPPNG